MLAAMSSICPLRLPIRSTTPPMCDSGTSTTASSYGSSLCPCSSVRVMTCTRRQPPLSHLCQVREHPLTIWHYLARQSRPSQSAFALPVHTSSKQRCLSEGDSSGVSAA